MATAVTVFLVLAAGQRSGAALDGYAGGSPSPAKAVSSPNWSGYVVTGKPGTRYSSATGTWTEPTVSCDGDSNTFATIAVGLGGYGSNAQSDEQVGTDANCLPSGKPQYFGWFDVAPYPSYRVPRVVSAGDVLTATVTIDLSSRPPLIKVGLDDLTGGWSFERGISWVSAGQFLLQPGEQNTGGPSAPAASSAEWLVEAPVSCHHEVCEQASLANFGSVAMSEISASTTDGEGRPRGRRQVTDAPSGTSGRLRHPARSEGPTPCANPSGQALSRRTQEARVPPQHGNCRLDRVTRSRPGFRGT
jgi:Peptidase A4 family